MTNIFRTISTLLMVCAALAAPPVHADKLTTTADIKFTGSSTLHDFEGTVATEPFVALFTVHEDTGMMNVSAKTSISVADMTTDNRKRDRNMHKMFDLEQFKIIEGELADAQIAEGETSKTMLHLNIRNVEHDVEATLSNLQRSENQFSCTMTFPVSLQAFELKAPSVMGMIKVSDTVTVECSIKGTLVDPTEED